MNNNNNDIETSVNNQGAIASRNDQEECFRSPQALVPVILFALVVLMGVALGLSIGLHDCKDIGEPFQVTATVHTAGPYFATSHSGSGGYPVRTTATTWHFPYSSERKEIEPLYMTTDENNDDDDEWFDHVIRIRNVDDKYVSITANFHILNRVKTLMRRAYPDDEMTDPYCMPGVHVISMDSDLLEGGVSQEYTFGTCNFTRVEDLHLESPPRLEVVYTGTFSIKGNLQDAPRYDVAHKKMRK